MLSVEGSAFGFWRALHERQQTTDFMTDFVWNVPSVEGLEAHNPRFQSLVLTLILGPWGMRNLSMLSTQEGHGTQLHRQELRLPAVDGAIAVAQTQVSYGFSLGGTHLPHQEVMALFSQWFQAVLDMIESILCSGSC